MKNALLLTVFVVFFSNLFAQKNTFELGLYGAYSIDVAYTEKLLRNPNFESTFITPIGMKAYYNFTKKEDAKFYFGLGLDVNFRQKQLVSKQYFRDSSYYESFGDGAYYDVYEFQADEKSIVNTISSRLFFTTNWKVSTNTTLYGEFGFGYNHVMAKRFIQDTEVGLKNENRVEINQVTHIYNGNPTTLNPLSMRFAFGLKQQFSDHLNAKIDVGLGNYLTSVGLYYSF